MVLTPETSPKKDRGQVITLIIGIFAFILIMSMLFINLAIPVNVDQSEGVSTPPDTHQILSDIDSNVMEAITVSNREGDFDLQSSFEQQETLRNFQSQDLDIRNIQTSPGQRAYNPTKETLVFTNNAIELDGSEKITGHIEVNTSESSLGGRSNPESNAFHIETNDYDLYIYEESDQTVAEYHRSGSLEETYQSDAENVFIDLGEGSFDGYKFPDYNADNIETIDTQNGAQAVGYTEFIGTSFDNTAPELTVEAAIFGVEYDVSVSTKRHSIETRQYTTANPFRGDL